MKLHTFPTLAFVSLFAVLAPLAGCASASQAPAPEEEPDAAQSENALVKSCPSQCAMDYSACFQFSDGDLCGCYPSYVSCMKGRCHLPPAIEKPDCSMPDTGVPDTGAPDTTPTDTADPCPIECHCPNRPGVPPAPACTNTCAECKAACKVPHFEPCG